MLACPRLPAGQADPAAPGRRPPTGPRPSSPRVTADSIPASELDKARAANRLRPCARRSSSCSQAARRADRRSGWSAAEAKARGVSAEELLKQEVDAKAAAPAAAYVEQIYEQNKARFGTTPRDEALAQIREILGERAVAERRAAFEKELRGRAKVAVRLDAPRATVAIPAGAPATGPATAPVTIVEFTDYQCPYCHRAQAVIEESCSATRARSASSTSTSRSTATPRPCRRPALRVAPASRAGSGSSTAA